MYMFKDDNYSFKTSFLYCTYKYKMSEIVLDTAPGDKRFRSTNQTHRCWVNFNEYLVCVESNDDDAGACKSHIKAYQSICPSEWVENWTEQVEAGTFPGVTFNDGKE